MKLNDQNCKHNQNEENEIVSLILEILGIICRQSAEGFFLLHCFLREFTAALRDSPYHSHLRCRGRHDSILASHLSARSPLPLSRPFSAPLLIQLEWLIEYIEHRLESERNLYRRLFHIIQNELLALGLLSFLLFFLSNGACYCIRTYTENKSHVDFNSLELHVNR